MDVPLGLQQILSNIADEFLDVGHFSLIPPLLGDDALCDLGDVLYLSLVFQLIAADGYQLGVKTLLCICGMNDENSEEVEMH